MAAWRGFDVSFVHADMLLRRGGQIGAWEPQPVWVLNVEALTERSAGRWAAASGCASPLVPLQLSNESESLFLPPST